MSNLLQAMQEVSQREAAAFVHPQLGVVTEIFPHADEGDKDNYQVSVKLKNLKLADGSEVTLTKVPVLTPYIGMTCIPNMDDLVLINFVGGDLNAPIVTGRLYNDVDLPPVNNEKEIEIRHSLEEGGAIKIDAEGVITITSKSEENIVTVDDEKVSISNEKFTITVDFSGGKISVESDGDIELKAPKGAITLEGKEVNIKSSASLKVEAGADAEVKATAGMVIKGATIDLN